MTIGVVTDDSVMRDAIARSLALVTLPWMVYPSVAALAGHRVHVVLWDERQYTDALLDQLVSTCSRIICVWPKAKCYALRFGPVRPARPPLWFHIAPGEPDEYVIVINRLLEVSTESLQQQWVDWRAARQTSQHGSR